MKVIIAAAGTGGHINPGIAIANKIKEEEPNSEIIFIGTDRGLETDLVPRAGYELKTIKAFGFKKEMSFKNFKNLLTTLNSVKKARKIIREFKPDIIIGTGGYICVTVILAAKLEKIPIALHESNAFPGKAVKLFSKNVDLILLGFEETKKLLPKVKKAVYVGNPTKIKKLKLNKDEILKKMNIHTDKPIVLVTGGSQGAKSINDALTEMIKNDKIQQFQLIWATGPKQYEGIKEELLKQDINIDNIKNVKALSYIYNMEELINIADLLVCRSGAMTITETAIVGKPAIFVPLPSRMANRQVDNAKVLEKVGAAKIILNEELNADILEKTINDLVKDKNNLGTMGKNAEKLSVHNVEEKIYVEIKDIIKQRV